MPAGEEERRKSVRRECEMPWPVDLDVDREVAAKVELDETGGLLSGRTGDKQPESVLIYVARSNRVRLHRWELVSDFSVIEGLRSRLLYRTSTKPSPPVATGINSSCTKSFRNLITLDSLWQSIHISVLEMAQP